MSSQQATNILFVLPNFDTGGSEKLVLDIIRNLDRARFNASIAVFYNGEYEQECRALEIPLYVVHPDPKNERSKLETIRFLSDIVRKEKIHIVNSHHTSPLLQGFIPFRILNRVRWIHTEHTPLSLEVKIQPRHIFLERNMLLFVDCVLGISDGVMDYYRNELRIPEKKLVRILNGVRLDRFKLDHFDASAFRRANGLEPNDFVVGMFANFRHQKNHANLLRAIAQLPGKDTYRFRLLLAGTGPTFDESVALHHELGLEPYVRFLGPRHDIPKLMNALDVYALPSRYEGLPFSLIEAMAAGKPIVTTNVVGNREVAIPERNALVVPDDDPSALASSLERIMKDRALRDKLGSAGLEDAEQYSFDRMIAEYDHLFSSFRPASSSSAMMATC